jgi:hypothetical protein
MLTFDLLDGTPDEIIHHYREIYEPGAFAEPYYFGLTILYRKAGDTAAWRAYADSARIELEATLAAMGSEGADSDEAAWAHSILGYQYAWLGDFERAKKEAQKGMDLTPISSCHF